MYEYLQNGSDIRGIALDGVVGEKVNITNEVAYDIAKAFAKWLKKKACTESVTVAVGRDSRLTGEPLARSIFKGLDECGVSIIDAGLTSTPAMFMSTSLDGWKVDGALMITASHLPKNRNGFKFFTKDGGLEKSDIADILASIETATTDISTLPVVMPEKRNLIKDYSKRLRDIICESINASDYDRPLQGLHIVVDAGNGVGGFFAKDVLEPLGADTSGSRYLEPDGSFPNHIPDPENEEAMQSIADAVMEARADIGFIFDTDVDRAGAVLSDGNELNRNKFIAAMTSIVLQEEPGSTIVTDSVTSTGLTKFIEAKGGIHHRFKRGYKNVINESIRLNNEGQKSSLAMETSGHGALKENFFLDDGAYLCLKLLIELGKGNDPKKLVEGLEEPLESEEVRIKFTVEDFRTAGEKILENLKALAASKDGWSLPEKNFEGVRVDVDRAHGDGWFLLRMSLHEPIMPLNIESNMAHGVLDIAKDLLGILRQEKALDVSTLESLIQKLEVQLFNDIV